MWSGDISGAVTIGSMFVAGTITLTDNTMTALVMTFEYSRPDLFDVTAYIQYEPSTDGSTRFFGTGELAREQHSAARHSSARLAPTLPIFVRVKNNWHKGREGVTT